MNFNPTFEKYQEIYGFDDSINPHWQMVPLGGEKFVYLANAEGMTVQAVDSSVVQISEVSNNLNVSPLPHKKRLFTIRGISYGVTHLEVRKNNLLMTKLEVAVKKPKIVSLAFNFVSDIKRSTKKLPCDVDEWFKGLNKIFSPQTNISFTHRSTNSLNIKNDLGPEIDFTDAKGSHWEKGAIRSQGDRSANLNLFYVWKLVDRWEPGEAFFVKGETLESERVCFMSDQFFISTENEIIILAHEIAHALGIQGDKHFYHPKNRKKYVMFYSAKFAGKEFPKVHANIVNP